MSRRFHTDKEPDLVVGSTVVSMSLGASRTFWFKCNRTKREKGFILNDGDLCIMGKDSQIKYQHGLKSEISSEVIFERISITFREFK